MRLAVKAPFLLERGNSIW